MLTPQDMSVRSSAHRHGQVTLTSAELERRLPELSEGWCEKYLGVHSRQVLEPGGAIADLGIEAVTEAVERAGLSIDDVDALVCGTTFPDHVTPSTGSAITQGLRHDLVTFDVNAACATFPYALKIATSLASFDSAVDRVVVCVAEHATAWADPNDPESCVFWGDASGAVVVEKGRVPGSFRVVGMQLANDSEFAERVLTRRDGTFKHDGRYSYQQVLRLTEHVARDLTDEAGVAMSDLRAFVGHQSNVRLLEALGEKLGVVPEQMWTNVAWAGNQGGAGCLTAFSEGWHDNHESLTDGDLVLVAAVGAGYTAGAVLLEWCA